MVADGIGRSEGVIEGAQKARKKKGSTDAEVDLVLLCPKSCDRTSDYLVDPASHICLSQSLSHACLSIKVVFNYLKLRMAH